MLVAITGTPGTGKTSITEHLSSLGYHTISLDKILTEQGLMGEYDNYYDSHIIDIGLLKNVKVGMESLTFVEGHLSHYLPCDLIIVLRCNPKIIENRLRARGYSANKISQNVESEVIDQILVESIETDSPTFEIDCSDKTIAEVGEAVIQIINGDVDDHLPGKVNWLEL